MKKKGFTLVELLAVIAILAILVIVAMPNVLGMFNQAKSSTFVTEVQTYMDSAKTEFISASLTSTGSLTFSNQGGTGVKKLKMDGAEKDYVIELDTYGNFKRVLVWDKNFCYDSSNLKGSSTWATSNDKESVKVEDIHVAVSEGADTEIDSATNGCKGAFVTVE